jgi:hypothetical protein
VADVPQLHKVFEPIGCVVKYGISNLVEVQAALTPATSLVWLERRQRIRVC